MGYATGAKPGKANRVGDKMHADLIQEGLLGLSSWMHTTKAGSIPATPLKQ